MTSRPDDLGALLDAAAPGLTGALRDRALAGAQDARQAAARLRDWLDRQVPDRPQDPQ